MELTAKPKTKTEQILSVMYILAWVAFVGFLLEAGAIVVSYGVSCLSADSATILPHGLNLYNLRQYNFWHYTLYVSFITLAYVLKSFTAFLVIKAIKSMSLKNPFTIEVAVKLEKISFVMFGTWVVAMLTNVQLGWLLKISGELYVNWISGEFIFMAGVVFVISQIFKRGIEIQSENDLTV
jgi:hypothetical protein